MTEMSFLTGNVRNDRKASPPKKKLACRLGLIVVVQPSLPQRFIFVLIS